MQPDRPKTKPLNPRHEMFIAEYLKTGCGKEAAVRAGFSPRSAKQGAYKLLRTPRIAAAVALAKENRDQRLAVALEGLEPLLDSYRVGEILSLPGHVVKQMAADGQIPAFKVGGFWRFRASELRQWIDRQRVPVNTN
jgi:excisionase family DNA binding protein